MRQALDEHPTFVEREGSFAMRTEDALLEATSAASWILTESRRRVFGDVKREIAGVSPNPLEAAIARCVALSLAEVEYLDTLAFRGELSDQFDRRRSRAHARAMSAAKTLATLRRLAIPVVQVNVAREQVNIAVAASREPSSASTGGLDRATIRSAASAGFLERDDQALRPAALPDAREPLASPEARPQDPRAS